MKRVYFVRHAKSVANETRTVEIDDQAVPLSSEGEKQADSVAGRFRKIPIDIIISSHFIRTRQTAEEIKEVTGKEIIESELFRERRHPSMLKGKQMDSKEVVDVRKLLYENAHKKDWYHSDEENYWDLLDRARKAVTFLDERNEKSIAVVTHAVFMKAILTVMMFGDDAQPYHYEAMYHFMLPKNTGITICEYKPMSGAIRSEPQWRLMTFNDYAHLGE